MNCKIETHQFLTTWESNLSEQLKTKYFKNWVNNENKGYFGFIPHKATSLFVGTFPVPEQRTTGFFYHSGANLFWRILETLSGEKLLKVENKLNWLSNQNIGITDIICKAQRTDKNCSSRSDKDLNVLCFNNLFNILIDFSSVTDIYLTSGGPKSKSLSGKSAGGWIGKHLREATGKSIKKISFNGASLKIKIHSIEREINLHYLITPAPQDNQLGKYLKENPNAAKTFEKLNIFQNVTDLKEKYKAIQWATYLSKNKELVKKEIIEEIKKSKLNCLLMEKVSR